MLWSQELPAYSYTHRLGSLSQGMPYCPFCQNSVPSTRAAPGHAIARKPLPGISKTWPLFEHVNSFQLDKKLTLDCQNTSNTNDSKKKCLPSWWVVLHGDYQQAHATQQTPSQGASAEATWKQDFHCRMHWFNDSYMNSCSLVTNLCRSMALNPHLNFPSIFSTTRIPWLLNWFQWLVQSRSPLKKGCPRVTRSWKSSRYSKIIKDLRLPKRLARWHPPSLSMSLGPCAVCADFSACDASPWSTKLETMWKKSPLKMKLRHLLLVLPWVFLWASISSKYNSLTN